MPELPQDIDWVLTLTFAAPAIAFIVGWWLGRRGSSSRGLYAIAKAIREHGRD